LLHSFMLMYRMFGSIYATSLASRTTYTNLQSSLLVRVLILEAIPLET